MFLPYMPAPEFNKWYLEQTLKSAINGFAITKEEEMPSLARQQTDAFNKSIANMGGPRGQVTISIATTEFKGISTKTNRPVVGAFASSVTLTRFANSPGQGLWQPTQMLMTGCTEGEGLTKRQAILQAALGQILRTWQVNPAWQQQLNQQVSAGTQQVIGQAKRRNQGDGRALQADREQYRGGASEHHGIVLEARGRKRRDAASPGQLLRRPDGCA